MGERCPTESEYKCKKGGGGESRCGHKRLSESRACQTLAHIKLCAAELNTVALSLPSVQLSCPAFLMQSRRGNKKRKKKTYETGRSPVLPEATLLHSSTVPLCSIVADTSANDMHLWKQHERASATDSWKMAASVVVREGRRGWYVHCMSCQPAIAACLPAICQTWGSTSLAPGQPIKRRPQRWRWGETAGVGLYAEALVQSVVYEMEGDVGWVRKPYCWQNETQERAAGGLFRAFGARCVV